jgi:hypothetical protein
MHGSNPMVEKKALRSNRLTYSINAASYGNELRFVNEGGAESNCHCQIILGKDNILYAVYVTKRVIAPDEQLTVSYGQGYWKAKQAVPESLMQKRNKIKI